MTINLKNISVKKELFSKLAEELKFPDWWGENWDALYDCLKSLADGSLDKLMQLNFPLNLKFTNTLQLKENNEDFTKFIKILEDTKKYYKEKEGLDFTYELV